MIKNGENLSKRGQTRGQMQISFGMIFSIILIIVFLAFAFYAIRVFLGTQNDAQSAKLINDLQSDIDRIWASQTSAETKEYVAPGKADYACFIDFSKSAEGDNAVFYEDIKNKIDYVSRNFAFYPASHESFASAEIGHVDIERVTSEQNPACAKVAGGKVKFTLKKEYGENLITIKTD